MGVELSQKQQEKTGKESSAPIQVTKETQTQSSNPQESVALKAQEFKKFIDAVRSALPSDLNSALAGLSNREFPNNENKVARSTPFQDTLKA